MNGSVCLAAVADGTLRIIQALWVANRIQDTFRKSDLSTIKECRKLAEEILGKGWADKGAKIYDEGNRRDRDDFALWSIGHTHIDSAWLWPFTATQQKVARSWSTQLSLMEKYPEFKFTASTAQQYKWLETFYPKLFVKVQEAVKKGTFVPIGATWVENDANLPSGEAFVRQFVYGQRYFESRFGKRSNVFWCVSYAPSIIVRLAILINSFFPKGCPTRSATILRFPPLLVVQAPTTSSPRSSVGPTSTDSHTTP